MGHPQYKYHDMPKKYQQQPHRDDSRGRANADQKYHITAYPSAITIKGNTSSSSIIAEMHVQNGMTSFK
jgi:hypothetical protein